MSKTACKVLLFLFLGSPVFSTELLFFYERGCPYSAKIDDFLNKRIKPNYPLEIRAYEIHVPANARLMAGLARAYQAEDILQKGVPAVFIGEKALQGKNRLIFREIEQAVRAALRQQALSPLLRLREEAPGARFKSGVTLPAVIGAAAATAINPCTGAVLVLLLGTILVASRRRTAVFGAGFSFTAATFIAYFLIGLGLLATVQSSGIQRYTYLAVSILALFIGLWNMKDFFWKKRRPGAAGLPQGWQPFIKRSTARAAPVLGASFIGFAASIFLLPCTSGPYIVIIGMLAPAATRAKAIWLLLLYNSIFVLPFIIITLAVGFGLTTASRVEEWRLEKLRWLRLLTGVIMFFVGIVLFVYYF